ncbi:sodium:solute symporter [Pelagicoccus sp. SDUM812003]|uniref:sodium:solute symporter n=1 Tax=Pelagicoccus sp. SDUM812003 TaxID=3041267 RepID=UPI0028102B06|nr:sodium:solute symporter [Pelagicoccus sp. SDUM812003]MDQ8202026.1 sodium:solute symporter [Pelagicoccus sp. SDUM812003]
MQSTLELMDWAVIALYFVGIGLIAWWSGRNQKDTTDYFLAGRNAGFFAIGASIFTSNIGSEHIVGLAGQGASTGMAMAHWELHAWVMILLAYVFVPFYYKSGVYTIPEFLEKRFSSKSRLLLSLVSLVAYIFTKVSVTVYAGALVFQVLMPDTFGSPEAAFWVGAFMTVILTGLYTVFGGMKAVLYTSAPQAIILIFGSCLITFYGLSKLGGWGHLVEMASANSEQFALWRPLSDPDFPWLGVLIASPIIGVWYWCTDQYIVQRTLTAANLKQARKGALFGGLLKVTPVLIFLIPGLIGWALHQEGVITIPSKILPTGESVIDGDMVFPTLVSSLLPVGIRGLIVASMLAALMSSLASLFNSSASLFTVDIYEKMRPGMPPAHYVFAGRVATTVVVGAGMLWIPVMKLVAGGGLYQYLQSVQGYLAPPITAVFLLGLFWKRINAHGAAWGLGAGFGLGMLKLTIQTFFGASDAKFSDPAFLAAIGDFNFLYATGVLFALSIVIVIVASFMTEPPPAEKAALTYGEMIKGKDAEEIKSSWDAGNKTLTAIIAFLVVGLYLYFSFWLG